MVDWMCYVILFVGQCGAVEKADYSVLFYWGDGIYLVYLVECPMVVGVFYYGDFEAGFQDVFQMFYGDDDFILLLD